MLSANSRGSNGSVSCCEFNQALTVSQLYIFVCVCVTYTFPYIWKAFLMCDDSDLWMSHLSDVHLRLAPWSRILCLLQVVRVLPGYITVVLTHSGVSHIYSVTQCKIQHRSGIAGCWKSQVEVCLSVCCNKAWEYYALNHKCWQFHSVHLVFEHSAPKTLFITLLGWAQLFFFVTFSYPCGKKAFGIFYTITRALSS